MEKIDTSSITVKAYDSIKNLTLSEKIRCKINQEEIAGKLGIIRTPAISALMRLEAEYF